MTGDSDGLKGGDKMERLSLKAGYEAAAKGKCSHCGVNAPRNSKSIVCKECWDRLLKMKP